MKFFAVFLSACCACSMAAAQKKYTSGGRLRPEQAVMDIRHYSITADVDTDKKSIKTTTRIDFLLKASASSLIFDLLDSFTITSVKAGSRTVPYTYKNDLITISLPEPLPAGPASVTIACEGRPHTAVRPPWDDGFTWAKDAAGNPWVAVTAEGTGGKLYFPCKDHPSDEPDEGADLIVTTDKDLVVAGPGLLQRVTRKGRRAAWHWKTNYTINNYSIVFNIGKYKLAERMYTTSAGSKVPMQFYVLEENAAGAEHHLDLFEQSTRVQEKYFGEYPFVKEKIGMVETPHLGMEHQTMNAYGNKFNYSKVGGKDFDWLLHHELGHEWWGNKVTVKDWADFWIQEGICSFGDALYVREMEGEQAYLARFRQSYFNIANTQPVVQGKDLDEETAYIGDIYTKGAFFMHTLRFVTGDSVFFPALMELATSPAYTYGNLVTTADVEALFSRRSGRNLKPLFQHCLYTTEKLEILLKRVSPGAYSVSFTNLDMELPLQIDTDAGRQTVTAGKKPVTIRSSTLPVIDPEMYYLSRVVLE